jgi:Mobilization protein NikA
MHKPACRPASVCTASTMGGMTRTHRLIVRLTDAEMVRLRDRAASAGVTVSAYVRAAAGGTSVPALPARPGATERGATQQASVADPAADQRRLARERDRQARAILARANRGR